MTPDKINFTSAINRFDSELWHFHIKVPFDIVNHFKELGVKRFVCEINKKVKLHCAIMPAGNDYFFINLNKQLRKTLEVQEGTSITCDIWEDKSEYGMPMPEEFQEVLDTDIAGSVYFKKLTPGKQRSLIYLVSKLKNTDKRIVKSLIILNHLTANQGQLDFKMLNQAFKQGLDL